MRDAFRPAATDCGTITYRRRCLNLERFLAGFPWPVGPARRFWHELSAQSPMRAGTPSPETGNVRVSGRKPVPPAAKCAPRRAGRRARTSTGTTCGNPGHAPLVGSGLSHARINLRCRRAVQHRGSGWPVRAQHRPRPGANQERPGEPDADLGAGSFLPELPDSARLHLRFREEKPMILGAPAHRKRWPCLPRAMRTTE